MHKRYLLIFTFVVLLTGCFPSTKILEDIQLVSAIGYDYMNQDMVQLNAMVAIPQSGEDQPPLTEVFSSTTHTSKMARMFEQAESPKPFHMGRLEVALYDKRLAQNGVFRLVDTLQRDPTIGRDLHLGVVDGSTKPVLQGNYKVSETPSKYLFLLLKQNMVSNIPKSNLHKFLYAYYGKGIDPFLPLLEKKGNRIKLKGTALLKNDKLAGEIDLRESFSLKLLLESFEKGMYEVRLKDEQYFVLQNLSSGVKYKFEDVKTAPKVNIHVAIKGRVNEAPDIPISKKPMVDELEKLTEKELNKSMNNLINKFQDLNVDPLGLGDRARSKTRKFDIKKWEEQYKDIPIHVSVDVQIIQAGITE